VLKLPLYFGTRQGFLCKEFDIKNLEFSSPRKRKISQIKKELRAIEVRNI